MSDFKDRLGDRIWVKLEASFIPDYMGYIEEVVVFLVVVVVVVVIAPEQFS